MFVSDFTKPPEEVVIDLINFDNGTAFTPSTLMVSGVPAAIPKGPPAFRNTEILVKPTGLTRKRGSARMYYNRVDLAAVPGLRSAQFNVPSDTLWLREIIPLVNERYNINLTPIDYIDVQLPGLGEEPVTVVLQAAAESLVYIGHLDLSIKAGVDTGIPLSTVIPRRGLDLFKFIPIVA